MILHVADVEIELRPGTVDDIPLLLSLMRGIAEFEKLEFSATEDSLREALFSDRPAAQTLLAFVDGKPAGYVTYFFSFASSVGRRGLWLDDVFVHPDFRNKGLGKALMSYMADLAVRNNCERFEWMVLDWNEPAIGLYERLGAKVLEDWRICRLDGDSLREAAGQHTRGNHQS